MAEPSDYELAAWRDLQRFTGRPVSRGMRSAGEHVASGGAALGQRATKYLDNHARAQSAVSHGQEIVARGAHAVGAGARGAAGALPDELLIWEPVAGVLNE